MKLLLLACLVSFSCLAHSQSQPEWAGRENIILKQDSLLWIKGISSHEYLDQAKKLSDLDAKKNISEYLSPTVTIWSVSKLEEEGQGVEAMSNTVTQAPSLPLKLEQKRQWIN